MIDPATGEINLTNTFRFTWVREEGLPLRRMVVPRTYAGAYLVNSCYKPIYSFVYGSIEAMQWLEGKRALDTGAEIRALRNP